MRGKDTESPGKAGIQAWPFNEVPTPFTWQPRILPIFMHSRSQQRCSAHPETIFSGLQSCLHAMVPITKQSFKGCRSKLSRKSTDATDLDQGLPHLHCSLSGLPQSAMLVPGSSPQAHWPRLNLGLTHNSKHWQP